MNNNLYYGCVTMFMTYDKQIFLKRHLTAIATATFPKIEKTLTNFLNLAMYHS